TIAEIWQKWGLWHRISAFLPDSRSFKAAKMRPGRAPPPPEPGTRPGRPTQAGAADRASRRISVRRGEILDDLADVRLVDRRAIDLDHLGHFGSPKVLFEFFALRLRLDVVGGVTGGAIVLHHLEIGSRLEGGGFFRKRVVHGRRGGRNDTEACDGGDREEKLMFHDHCPHAAVTRTVSTTLRR